MDPDTKMAGLLVWVAWAAMAAGLGGCIEFFAEPPRLPPIEGDAAAPARPRPRADAAASDAALRDAALLDAGPPSCVAAVERCNGLDDDGDERVDEGDGETLCARLGSNAESAARVCAAGRCGLDCHAGRHDLDGQYGTGCEYLCAPVDPPDTHAREECNGRDDDCDGEIDEVGDLDPPRVHDMVGVCADAPMACWRGEWHSPEPETLANGEREETLCDGLDNDCDGARDEGIYGCSCRIDEAGATRCEQGCDGRDDDEDGRSDEACWAVTCGPERDILAPVPPCNGCPDGTRVVAGWVCIPPGEFMMGSPAGEEGRGPEEGPQWPVRITRPFLMQRTEVTQRSWTRLFHNPSRNQNCNECPVERVNWYEALMYAVWFAAIQPIEEPLVSCYTFENCEGQVGRGMRCAAVRSVAECNGYRLPTEAEWEYAARAGSQSRYFWGEDDAGVPWTSWYRENARDQTHAVGLLLPNRWGLHDMYGNVWEVVWDWLIFSNLPPTLPVVDPVGPVGNEWRRVRGGSYIEGIEAMRSAERNFVQPHNTLSVQGFRLVRSLP